MPVRIGSPAPVSSPMIVLYVAPPGKGTSGRSDSRITVIVSGMYGPFRLVFGLRVWERGLRGFYDSLGRSHRRALGCGEELLIRSSGNHRFGGSEQTARK